MYNGVASPQNDERTLRILTESEPSHLFPFMTRLSTSESFTFRGDWSGIDHDFAIHRVFYQGSVPGGVVTQEETDVFREFLRFFRRISAEQRSRVFLRFRTDQARIVQFGLMDSFFCVNVFCLSQPTVGVCGDDLLLFLIKPKTENLIATKDLLERHFNVTISVVGSYFVFDEADLSSERKCARLVALSQTD
jgi:hypothetical protein